MQELIIETATKHFIKYGFKTFTMDDLAKQLGMSKKTLYEHYSSKSELVQACLDEMMRDLQDCRNFTEGNGNIIENVFNSQQEFIEKYEVTNACPVWDLKKYYPKQHEYMREQFRKFHREFAEKLIDRGLAEGLFRENIDKDFAKVFFHSMNNVKDELEFFPELNFSMSYIAKKEFEYFIRILANEKGMRELERILEKDRNNS